MFTSQNSRIPGLVKSLVVVTAMTILAFTSIVAPAMASTEADPQLPGNEIDSPFAEMCRGAVDTFIREVDWIYSHESGHPRMDQHVDAMWAAWHFAEFTCGIDVGGDGDIG